METHFLKFFLLCPATVIDMNVCMSNIRVRNHRFITHYLCPLGKVKQAFVFRRMAAFCFLECLEEQGNVIESKTRRNIDNNVNNERIF